MTDDVEAALLSGINAMLDRAQDPAVNDPSGFDTVEATIGEVRTLRRSARSALVPAEEAAARLAGAARVLPLAAACTPGQALRLVSECWHLARSAMRGRDQDQLLRHPAGTSVLAARPGLSALHAVVTTPRDAVFPNGLQPVEPPWPADVTGLSRGARRASLAFTDLHLRGSQTIREHFDLTRLPSMDEVDLVHRAARFFAVTAAGPAAEQAVHNQYRWAVLRRQGPQAALTLARPAAQWEPGPDRRSGDVAFLHGIASALMKAKDWPAAAAVLDQLFSRPDLLDDATRTDVVKHRTRVDKQLRPRPQTGPQRAPTPDGASGRPRRTVARPAAPRPQEAQDLVDAAASGDTSASQFMAAMAGPASRALANDPRLTPAHLWLLHELDDPTINADLAAHPAATIDLLTSIVTQAGHGQAAKMVRLSRSTTAKVQKRPGLLPAVLRHALDPDLVAGALARHGHQADPADVAALALRSLDLPADRALPVLDAVTRHLGDRLPPELAAAVQDATTDAAGNGDVDRSRLRAALTPMASAPPAPAHSDVPAPADVSTELDPDTLIRDLEQANSTRQAATLLGRWPGQLPWTELHAALEAGRLGSRVAEHVVGHLDASARTRRAFIAGGGTLYRLPRGAGSADSWVWMDALLEPPLPMDRHSRTWRERLAAELLVSDPRDLRERLPRDELRRAAEAVLGVTVAYAEHATAAEGDPDTAQRVAARWALLASWCAEGLLDPEQAAADLPVTVAVTTLHGHRGAAQPAAERQGSADSLTWETLPAVMRAWFAQEMADEDVPEKAQVAARARVGSWPGSLRSLADWACTRAAGSAQQ